MTTLHSPLLVHLCCLASYQYLACVCVHTHSSLSAYHSHLPFLFLIRYKYMIGLVSGSGLQETNNTVQVYIQRYRSPSVFPAVSAMQRHATQPRWHIYFLKFSVYALCIFKSLSSATGGGAEGNTGFVWSSTIVGTLVTDWCIPLRDFYKKTPQEGINSEAYSEIILLKSMPSKNRLTKHRQSFPPHTQKSPT